MVIAETLVFCLWACLCLDSTLLRLPTSLSFLPDRHGILPTAMIDGLVVVLAHSTCRSNSTATSRRRVSCGRPSRGSREPGARA